MINKKIKLSNTLGFGSTVFSEQEITELKDQGFVKDIGRIITAGFRLSGSFFMGASKGLSSELFVEAVEKRFLDKIPANWAWKPGDTQIPVIICRDFLALYNFGFASAQNLPQLTEDTFGLLKMNVFCTGDKKQMSFSAHIAGYTDRFSTILVPVEFINWANKNIGKNTKPAVSRLILKIDNTQESLLTNYFKQHSYETNREKLTGSQLARTLYTGLFLISAFGTILILVSILSLVLIIQLLINHAKQEIKLLHQLGFTDSYLSSTYALVLLPILGIPFILAGSGVLAAGFVLRDILKKTGIHIDPLPSADTYISFIILLLSAALLFYLLIRRHIYKIT